MGNIETKTRENLSFNAKVMVDRINCDTTGRSLPAIVYVDASVEEISEAVKYLIDSSWATGEEVYAKKVKCNIDKSLIQDGVVFSHDRGVFQHAEQCQYISKVIGTPMIFGTPIAYEDNSNGCLARKHDGDVFIELKDGELVSMQEWKDQQEHKTMAMSFKARKEN